MKLGPVGKGIAVAGLAISVLAAIRWIDSIPAERLASLMGVSLTVSGITPTPTPLDPTPTMSAPVSALSRGTVAVQTFGSSSLIARGSGTIVSSDGLILTTSFAAPYGSGAYVYQVSTADGAMLRATGIWRASGLVLLKVQATDLDAVLFDESVTVRAGDTMTIVGAFVSLSQYVPIVVPATVPYATDSRNTALSFDRVLVSSLYGARVVTDDGRSVGIMQPTSPVARLLSASDINDILERYLASTQKR